MKEIQIHFFWSESRQSQTYHAVKIDRLSAFVFFLSHLYVSDDQTHSIIRQNNK